ncbi:MAG: hypothetical protein ACRDGG_01865 [Anaerolineae bacterium]
MDWRKLRERYLKDEWPIRLGNLASTLGRVAQRAANPDALAGVPPSLRESMLLIEWNLGRTPSEVLIALAPMQSELRLWWRGWDSVAQSPVLRTLLSRRAREMSDRALALSGLLNTNQ